MTITRPHPYIVSVVIPAFNESENLAVLIAEVANVLQRYHSSEILVVDDGSRDDSSLILRALSMQYPTLRYILLSRNFGHQNALKAGLDNCIGDLAISLDADLQHPSSLIPQMVQKWLEGYDVVCTKRCDRETVSLFKRATAAAFYQLINFLSETPVEPGSADFRLLDRKVLNVLHNITERPVFLRGLIPWLGFSTYWISYSPNRRLHGHSKYNLKKLFSLALVGITSSSIKPLRFSAYLGTCIAAMAILYAVFALVCKIFYCVPLSGWTSLIVVTSLLGALQLLMLGVIGEYIGRILLETKGRPIYVIKEISGPQDLIEQDLPNAGWIEKDKLNVTI